jgi:predicted NAD/FAD-dependent oxidoreductase
MNEVVIVGAGLAGLACAQKLTRAADWEHLSIQGAMFSGERSAIAVLRRLHGRPDLAPPAEPRLDRGEPWRRAR